MHMIVHKPPLVDINVISECNFRVIQTDTLSHFWNFSYFVVKMSYLDICNLFIFGIDSYCFANIRTFLLCFLFF